MPNPYRNTGSQADNYDPRWFIWTIVILVVSGIGLTSYIMLSDHGTLDPADTPRHLTNNQ